MVDLVNASFFADDVVFDVVGRDCRVSSVCVVEADGGIVVTETEKVSNNEYGCV